MLKKILKIASLFLLPAGLFAQDAATKEESPFALSLSTMAAFYTDVDFEPGDDHFASLNGPVSGAKALTRLDATYTLPTPLGEHWLLKDANLKFRGSLELSPVSVRPIFKTEFTPVPFLVFGAGTSIGTGWNPLGFDGMSIYNFEQQEFQALTPFKNYYYDYFATATFQFDTGALIKGDWNHIVTRWTYKWIYMDITGTDKGDVWSWQVYPGQASGWQYDVVGILGYQMPLVLDMVGVVMNLFGHYDPEDYSIIRNSFDGDFMWIDFSLLLDFKLNKSNSMMVLITFEGSRSYTKDHSSADEEPMLTVCGREWSFYRVAIGWDHDF